MRRHLFGWECIWWNSLMPRRKELPQLALRLSSSLAVSREMPSISPNYFPVRWKQTLFSLKNKSVQSHFSRALARTQSSIDRSPEAQSNRMSSFRSFYLPFLLSFAKISNPSGSMLAAISWKLNLISFSSLIIYEYRFIWISPQPLLVPPAWCDAAAPEPELQP